MIEVVLLLVVIFILCVIDRYFSREYSRQRVSERREYEWKLRNIKSISQWEISKLIKENTQMLKWAKTIGRGVKMPPYDFVWGSIRMIFQSMNKDGTCDYGGWNKATQETGAVQLAFNTQQDVWLPVERVMATRIDCLCTTG